MRKKVAKTNCQHLPRAFHPGVLFAPVSKGVTERLVGYATAGRCSFRGSQIHVMVPGLSPLTSHSFVQRQALQAFQEFQQLQQREPAVPQLRDADIFGTAPSGD